MASVRIKWFHLVGAALAIGSFVAFSYQLSMQVWVSLLLAAGLFAFADCEVYMWTPLWEAWWMGVGLLATLVGIGAFMCVGLLSMGNPGFAPDLTGLYIPVIAMLLAGVAIGLAQIKFR
ncbi:hypothetical protein A2886_00690 [candidate division WWE3 bacterium RIFCSPHIGHO2_01_FULL_42_13]|uniref:Uncharacterized protein n=1 Tax=candidate division WWE3 bacterium RIFCSPHIGHO2_01_FULL_42_13 TaxID=1802617 RepID=A0A1F4UQS8_UNCKA|nr:MAG: hypothetical protein A2886_00690 [candidate division WWE3 bacterium RIFCSPHIGHO2_01_FULL_42_13]